MCIANKTFSQNSRIFLAQVDLNNKHGCIDLKGKVVIPVTYDDMGQWGNNLIPVNMRAKGMNIPRKGGKWGYCNTQGKLKIALQFDEAMTFHEGMAAVRIKNKWGFIDTTGKLIITPQYDNIRIFSEGLCAVAKSRKWGFIDLKGKIVVKLQYGALNEFENGIASAFAGEIKEGYEQFAGAKYCLINKNGERICEPKFKSIGQFREGLARVQIFGGEYQFDTKTGFINEKGELIIPAIYEDGKDFSEGMSAVAIKNKKTSGQTYLYGFINTKGEEIVKPQYDRVTRFINGKAVVEKGRQGSSVEIGIDTRDQSAAYDENLVRCAVINKEGNFILNFEWRNMYPVNNDLFIVNRAKYDGTGVINSKGESVIPFEYKELQNAGNNLFIIIKRKESESENLLVDTNNKVLFTSKTHYLKRFINEVGVLLIRSYKTGKSGLINVKGEMIIKDIYDSISDFYATEK
jgi:hypothetical protein